MLALSFIINNSSPPDNATAVQLSAFGQQHFATIMWGAWLQAVSPVLIILFAFAIVFLAGAMTRLAGWMTMFGAGVLMTVSLVEVTFYIGTLENGLGLISLGLIHAVQHLYFIVAAPAFMLPLGVVILGSRVLPHVLGYLALALGVGFAALGVGFLYALTLPALVTYAAFLSAVWFWAAAITLFVRTLRGPSISTEFHA
ncbi:MAG: hypothetical protein LBJ87_09305 [bacterium]|jgi:hypothetical protein|nr:hypothetical protein [bacterium]